MLNYLDTGLQQACGKFVTKIVTNRLKHDDIIKKNQI